MSRTNPEMAANGSVLVVDSDSDMASTIAMILGDGGEGHDVTICSDGEEALALAREESSSSGEGGSDGRGFDLVLADFRLPGLGGMDLLKKLREDDPQRPVILMTASGNTELAIVATKQGAYDFLVKPFDVDELVEVISQALRASQTMRKPVRIGKAPATQGEPGLIGSCRAMQQVYKEIGRFAPTCQGSCST